MFIAKIKFQRKKFLLDVDIKLNSGQIRALVGPSGSGKTSLMRLMAGLEKPQSGVIYAGDKVLYCEEGSVNLSPQKRKVGLMFQDYALFDHLNVAENIAYGVVKQHREKNVKHWLRRINLHHREKDYPHMLSGGEKQRVALARTLACNPDVLLLDEPFSALDTILRHELRREIQSLIQDADIPVLIATHDLEEARLIADQVSVMVEGEIVREGNVGEVFRDPRNFAAASALGWQNILQIERTEENILYGSWGQFELPDKPLPNVRALGLSKGSIRFVSEGVGIIADIIHIADFDDVQMIEVKLADKTKLIFEQKFSLNLLKVNQRISIGFDSQRIKLFYQ